MITTDQGCNFESHLFRELTNILSTHHIHSILYHSQSNGAIERFHRLLKSAIVAHNQPRWAESLPIVLLGIRSTMKINVNATCAELV